MMAYQHQLTQLSQRVAQVVVRSQQLNSSHSLRVKYLLRDRALFYPGLFHCQGQPIADYVRELEFNMQRLQAQLDKRSERDDKSQQTVMCAEFLLQQVAHQFRALHNLLQQCNQSASTGKRSQAADNQPDYIAQAKKLLQKSHALYQQLAQQLEYERRLQEMIEQQANDPQQQQHTRERLLRCQLTTAKVRSQLERYEQKQDN